MDKKIAMFFLCGLFAIFVIPSIIRAASFDCSKASTKTEKAICSDPMLSILDDDMATTYSKALKTNASDSIKNEQRKWLKDIIGSCQGDKVCIKKAYENRLCQLKSCALAGDSPTVDESYKLFKALEFKDCRVCESVSKIKLNQLYKLELIPLDISFVGKEGNVVLTNCNVYIKATQQGASPQSNRDLKMNNYYYLTCGTLNALKYSKKALCSFVDCKIPKINQLPVAIIIPATDDVADELLSDSQRGVTIEDYCRDNKMQCDKSDEVLTIENYDGDTRLELVSIGDFDRDGLEDILLYYTDYGKRSTWIAYSFLLLSKSKKNQKLYNMRNIYGGCVMENNKYTCAVKYQWKPKE